MKEFLQQQLHGHKVGMTDVEYNIEQLDESIYGRQPPLQIVITAAKLPELQAQRPRLEKAIAEHFAMPADQFAVWIQEKVSPPPSKEKGNTFSALAPDD